MVLVPHTNGTEFGSGSLEKKLVFQVLFLPKKFQFQFYYSEKQNLVLVVEKPTTWFWFLFWFQKSDPIAVGFLLRRTRISDLPNRTSAQHW
jgi:hypothetical protein